MRPAFTLIESLMASVVLAMVVSAVLVPFTVAIQSRQDAVNRVRAQRSAVTLLETVLATAFYDPDDRDNRDLGPEIGESNSREFDNIDDWHGYRDRVIDDGGEDLTCRVTVGYVTPAGQPARALSNCCTVSVSVSRDGGEMIRLTRLVYAETQ